MSPERKGLNSILKFAIAFCILYSAFRAGQFIVSRIPPYREGQCLKPIRAELEHVTARVDKNHIIEGYSDMGVLYDGFKFDTLKVAFEEQRNSELKFEKINCN